MIRKDTAVFMHTFKLDIAGFCVKCTVNYEYSVKLCRGYTTDRDEDLEITVSPEEIETETARYPEENEHSPAFMETLALYRKICTELALRDTVLIHGSSLMADGEAVLFCANSGTGKSTHTRLWREVFGDKIVMINDDKPLVRLIEGTPYIYGTPWNGKHHIGTNISAPLRHVCFLERGEKNEVCPADGTEAFTRLLRFTFRPDSALETMAMLGTAEKIAGQVKFWDLKCNMDPEAAVVSYEGMYGKSCKDED